MRKGYCKTAAVAIFCTLLSACGLSRAVHEEINVRVGFFDDSKPVSYAAKKGASQRHVALGYEPDLLRAVAAIPGSKLSFTFIPISGDFSGIWLKAREPDFDLVCGGITIRKDRMQDASGKRVIAFTRKHIAFRQSLLVPAKSSLGAFADIRDPSLTVGAAPGTTGEETLLRFAGYIDDDGVLAAGTRVEVGAASGGLETVIADGSDRYRITAARATPALGGRVKLTPASSSRERRPTVRYMAAERDILQAFAAGAIDAFVRVEVASYDVVAETMSSLKIAALFPESLRDPAVEKGGCAMDIPDVAIRNRLNTHIKYLTDSGRIGYAQWHANNKIFEERAAARRL